ncbi:hypothetical protein QYE92_10010, partial [Enterobacter cloacae subsp. cloacae]|uniref:hypothetical protein n=1 Tax=Enterobacter cloacae TaxID=550 RepID=UPI002876A7A8
ADRNRSHWSTSKTPSYTKSVSWQHHQKPAIRFRSRFWKLACTDAGKKARAVSACTPFFKHLYSKSYKNRCPVTVKKTVLKFL